MLDESKTQKLKAAFTRALALPPDADFEALEYSKTTGWDSVAHMALVAEIETELDIMMDTDDVIALSSFPKAREIAAKY